MIDPRPCPPETWRPVSNVLDTSQAKDNLALQLICRSLAAANTPHGVFKSHGRRSPKVRVWVGIPECDKSNNVRIQERKKPELIEPL